MGDLYLDVLPDAYRQELIGRMVATLYREPTPPPAPPLRPTVHAPEIWFSYQCEEFELACSAKGCDWRDTKDPTGWLEGSNSGIHSSLSEMHAMFNRHLAARFHGL